MKRRLLSFVLAFAMLLSVTPVAVFAAGTAVAKIGNTEYGTLAEALEAAADGATIELIWADGGAPIAMEGAVYGKTVTITGTATVDWSKGNLFVGRGGEGNGTVIFDGANLTSASNSSAYGIHVSGREKDTTDKYDGTLVIKNSTIELDYLINRGTITVDNSTLTVKNGFGIAGRPASETESGETATATINITNGSYVKVLNPNGMGVGVASTTPEGKGILNLTDSTFECASFNIDADLGDFNVYGTSTLKIATLTGREIDLQHNAIIKDSTVGGEVMLYGKVTFKGDNTFAMLYDYGAAYSADSAEWIVEKDASVTLTNTDRYGFGYGDKVTIYGNLTDALSARENLSDTDADVNMYGGLVGMTNSSYANTSMVFKVEDAYVIFGVEGDKSFGNKPGYYGSYQFDFDNSVITANGFKFYEDNGKAVFTFNKSDLLVNGVFMTNDADSKFTFTDSVIVSKATSNGSDDKNQNAGELILNNSSLTYNAPFTNVGTLTLDMASTLTAPEISGDGKIVIDATNYVAGAELIDADLSDFEGKVETVGNDNVTVSLENGQLVIKAKVAKIGDVKYDSLQNAIDAAEAANTKDIVIDLVNDATLDITAWQTLAIGGEDTETITINGHGHTLVFNKKDSDWNHVATNNNAKLILNNMTLADSGYNDGPWNRYDINFACDVELNNVVSNKALAFKADATLNNVTVNESGDNYAIWIQADGQNVVANGLTVNAANGRGIKIDEQYVTDAAKVDLTVTNAEFTTAKKAAILVKTAGGADISVANVDISKVKADPINVVWVDEDSADNFNDVTVNGGRPVIESDNGGAVEGLNYVSLGDSMTNGYGFTGYNQGNLIEDVDFYIGNGVYGERAYPNTFAEWLAAKNGAVVHHARLGTSAMRAEDLYYLLGGREKPVDGWFDQVNYYTGVDDDAALAAFFQKEIANADVISMGVGNASFGAYLLQYVTDALGVMGGSLDEDEKVNLEMALIDLDPEQKELVLNIYNDLMVNMANYIPADLAAQYNVQDICDVLAYTTAGFLINYKGALERIVELNPDAEIILVGLMNTTYGMTITMPGMDPIPVGDFMDNFFGALNAYIAGLPTVLQASGKFADATFYYAELPNPRFISQEFDDLKANNWNDVDGLSGAVVRERNIKAYNDSLRELISQAFNGMLGGATLPKIDLEMVNGSKNCNQLEQISVAIYLGIEDAVAASTETMEIPLSGLMKIAGDLSGVFAGVQVGSDIRGSLYNALTANEEMKGMCKIYALFKVGNGMSVHPTPAAHDDLATAVINAYENGFTAEDQTKENLKVVIPAAYAQAYQYALANGYIDMAKGYIGIASGALGTANTYVSALEVPAQLLNIKALLLEEIGKTQVTLTKIDELLDINALTPETWAQILAMEEEIYAHMATLEDLAAELGVVGNIAMDQIGVVANYYAGVIDAIANNAYAWVANGVQEFNAEYAAWVESVGLMADKIDPELGAAVRAYLTETPAEALAIMYAAGDDAVVEFIATTAAASDDIKVIITAISAILNSDIADIAAAVKNSAEVAAILAQIDQVKAEIEATVAEMKNYPVSSALAYQQIINQLKGQLAKLQGQLVDAILNSVDDVDPTLRPLLNKALNALKDAVRVAANYGAEYGAWFDARFDEMLGDLLALLIDNTNEFGSIAGPILGETIDNFLHYVGDLAYEKGTELLDKVENEIIPEFIDTLKGYGAQAWAQLVAKLDALGLLDAVDQAQKDLNDLYELINSYITDDLADAYDTLLDRISELKDNIADLIETVGNELANTSEEELRATLAALQEKLENLYNAILALENVVNEAIHGSINTAIAMAQVALNNVAAAVADLAGVLSEDAAAAVADLANDVKVMLNEAYVDAITDTYTVTPDSYYVAMGDSSVFGENTYAQKLAAELGLTTSQFINLSAAGMSVAETIGLVNANASEIAKADLITIGYSNNTMMEFVIAQLKAATDNGVAQPMDWTALVGEKLVPHVQKALADITADMLASGVDAQYAELLSVAVEAYAYAAVSHALNYPAVVGSIHEINPDALVVIVGMYNPLAGVSVRLSSTETIEIGDYVQKLIDLANMETLAYAMLAPNTIYVDAPNVTTQAQPGEIPVVNFLMGLLMNGTDKYYATEDGHAYIAQQILNALTVTKSGLLGDANNDGVVNSIDAAMVLQYDIGMIQANAINLAVSDVNGDGAVNSIDAAMVLQYDIGMIQQFPAAIH